MCVCVLEREPSEILGSSPPRSGNLATLEANVIVKDKALPATRERMAVPAQGPRAVLPVCLGQLELLEDELDEQAIIFHRPVAVTAAIVVLLLYWLRFVVQAVKVGASQAARNALRCDTRALRRGGRLRRGFPVGGAAGGIAGGGEGTFMTRWCDALDYARRPGLVVNVVARAQTQLHR